MSQGKGRKVLEDQILAYFPLFSSPFPRQRRLLLILRYHIIYTKRYKVPKKSGFVSSLVVEKICTTLAPASKDFKMPYARREQGCSHKLQVTKSESQVRQCFQEYLVYLRSKQHHMRAIKQIISLTIILILTQSWGAVKFSSSL